MKPVTFLRGTVVEGAVWAAHAATYPLGLLHASPRLPSRTAGLPLRTRAAYVTDLETAGTPVLLVHGIADNRTVFLRLQRTLQHSGFGHVATFSYSARTVDLAQSAGRLARAVEELCEETGYDRVHVVGHSLGGLIARWYVQRMGGDTRVHTLVTLGTPHHGSVLANLLGTSLVKQLRPGSHRLRALDEPAPGCRTRFVAFWSDMDELVIPHRSAQLDHPDLAVRNVAVHGVGHMALPMDGAVIDEIGRVLAHLDSDGATRIPARDAPSLGRLPQQRQPLPVPRDRTRSA